MDKTREILHGKCHELKVQLRHQRCKLNGDDLESVNVKTISVLWVVILLTIALTACAVHQQTISQQSAVTSIATLPVAYTTQARDVLLYPIVNKVLMSSDLEALNSVVTRQGAAIKITSHSALILNDSVNIVEWDIKACNGVIYVVDRMLTVPGANTGETAQASQETAPVEATVVPEAVSASCQAGQSIAAILRSQERFSDFVGALESAGLMDKLGQDGAYTVFAIPNGVFVTSTLEASSKKITICHATGSKTNPYVEITISVNGLNGHDRHNDDIIPAPAGGCPSN